jgi:ubiquinone/menaquinone biosynthesis C-methylase UbiE
LRPVLRHLFLQLYHGLAWSYDLVAAVVSVGRWRDWIETSLPFIRGKRVLELAFGTGILQASLLKDGRRMVTGLDESSQMATLARRRLGNAGVDAQNLIRGRAERLPYASGAFDSVVSTFPTEFIGDSATLAEVGRVLRPGGRLIVAPAAWIMGPRLIDRAAAWLFKMTHQSPVIEPDEVATRFAATLERAGFKASYQKIEVDASIVLVIIGSK